MKLIAQLQEIRFPKPYHPQLSGIYVFQVTELYPDLPPISYKVIVGDWRMSFIKQDEGDYKLLFHDNPFEQYEQKANILGCELTIYPAFGETETANAA